MNPILKDERFKDTTILIVGGTGTIGKRLLELVLSNEPKAVRIFSRDEFKQFELYNSLDKKAKDKIRFLIGDVRDAERIGRACEGVDYIFDLAAMKHVPACEYNPFEAVKTNVLGTQNIIQAAISNNVKRVVYSSSDKSVNPTNAMGASKLLAERLISAAEYQKGNSKTIFSAVRFGNVMGSRGSVIPLFVKQILEQHKITVTSLQMSRFMMSISEAAGLLMRALMEAKGGEVFVYKMPVVRLADLAEVVIELVCENFGLEPSHVKVEEIGLRPGEKMFEELMTEAELDFAVELEDMYVIKSLDEILGCYIMENCNIKKIEHMHCNSRNIVPLSKEKIKEILRLEKIIGSRR